MVCLLGHGHGAGGTDQVAGISGGGKVEEGLGLGAEGRAVLGHQNEGALPSRTVSSLHATPSTVTALTVSLPSTEDKEA